MHAVALASLILLAAPQPPTKAPAPDAGSALPALPPLPQGDVFPYAKRIEKLPNGLTLVMVPFSANGIVAYDTLVRVGSRNEVEKGRSGYAHFFEHMMFRGTKANPEGKYNGEIRQLGIDSNAFTTDDYTLFHNQGPTSALPRLIALEADRFENLSYSKEAFQTEAKAVLGEYNKGASQPEEKLDEVLHDTAFTAHTYKHTTIGFLADIRAMPAGFAYSKQFFKKYYTPDNCILFVAGDFKPDVVLSEVQGAYAGWKGKAADPRPRAEPPQRKARDAKVTWPSTTLPWLAVAFHTPPDDPATKDAAVQLLLGSLLVGPTSELHQELVLEKQLAEGLESGYAPHRDPNLFTLLITAKSAGALPEIQKAVDAQLAALAGGKLEARTLQALKLNLIYSAIGQLETPGAVAMTLAMEAGPTGDPEGFDKLYAQVAKVTVQDLSDFAKIYLVPEGRTLITLEPKEVAP